MGLVDELVHKDAVLTAAEKGIGKLNGGAFERKDKRPPLHQLMEGLSPLRKIIYSQAQKKTTSNTKGNYPAAPKSIDSVEEGFENGMRAGLNLEAKNFGLLAATPEAQAM